MVSFGRRFLTKARKSFTAPIHDELRKLHMDSDPASQLALMFGYRTMAHNGLPMPRFNEVGFKCYSQCDEDGILLFIFAILGVARKLCVEIAAGDGMECNSANLIVNHGWHGLLVDGNQANVQRGRRFFAQSKHTYVYPPKFVCEWITRSSINKILFDNGFQGEIDLLSLDIDGVDYWVWEAIETVSPRVVVLEYQDILGPDVCWTVPYADDFSSQKYPTTDGMPNFAGASLAAFVKLGRRKGYRLVGVNRYGFNAFFVRNDQTTNLLPEVSAGECFDHPKVVWGMRERFPTVKDLPWVEV